MEPIIQYLFQNGKAQNSDGSYSGTVRNCSLETISLNLPGWGTLGNAMR